MAKINHVKNNILLLALLLSCCFGMTGCHPQSATIGSPSGNLQLEFFIRDGVPCYRLNAGQEAILTPSRLGFEFRNIPPMTENFDLEKTETSAHNETWEQVWGECRTVQNQYNELCVTLKQDDNLQRQVLVRFRVFDDGIGFRYEFPQQPNLAGAEISNELTEFTFAAEPQVWWIPVHRDNSYYESLYRHTPLSQTDTVNTPATFETAGGRYLAIHEANLTDFASMTLLKTAANQYKSELVPWADGVKVYAHSPFVSPWRTVIVAAKPGDLATSHLMLNLNDPCRLDDVSWIEPSKYIGIWWGMHLEKYSWGQGPKHGATTANTKAYIDFAAREGFNGVLVEGWNQGWDGDWSHNGNHFRFTQAYPDFDLSEITRYAVSKNVRLIGHHETAGAATNYENQLDSAFALYRKYGVNAVKTGYVNKYLDGKEWHDSQYGVRHYRKVAETAARYHIMIDNHEPVKGTGLQRTLPNLMTAEGGRGQEYDAWSPDGGNPPSHTTVLPFTRMLSGPFDFTPGTFNFNYETPNRAKVQTTLAKQLALFVVIFSPLQMASDLPENYTGQAFDFVKQVPCVWAETRIPDAQIGSYVVTARKAWTGDDWYLGAITNEEPRQLTVKTDFLSPDRTYTATIYRDGPEADYRNNPTAIEVTSAGVTAESVLTLNLAPGGGTAIRFTPQ